MYGDSVAPWTPVWIRLGGHKVVLTTAEGVDAALVVLASPWRKMAQREGEEPDSGSGKESLELIDVEVWSDAGWARARRLIRHRLADHKRLFRVATSMGVVDVTDDHSLIASDGSCVRARDAHVGTGLMHAPRFEFARHLASASSNHEQQLSAHLSPRVAAFVCGTDASEESVEVPPFVVSSDDPDVRGQYLMGLLHGSSVGEYGGGSFPVRNQRFAADVFALAESVGKNATICISNRDGTSSFDIRISDRHPPDDGEATGERVLSIEEIKGVTAEAAGGHPPYVYDFTTDTGRFAAGVGRIVVHNTDSIFIVFKNDAEDGRKLVGRDALASSIRQGQAASKGIKPQLAPPHNLEYEKTMFPLLLLSKKRYVGLLYENDPDAKPKQKSMGIALKRRDYAPIVKQVTFSLGVGPLPGPPRAKA